MTALLILALLLGNVAILLPRNTDAKGRCTEWDDEEQMVALRQARAYGRRS